MFMQMHIFYFQEIYKKIQGLCMFHSEARKSIQFHTAQKCILIPILAPHSL
jgi:hypothetical protein